MYFGDLKFAELHNFADASQIAYGAVLYLRMVDVEDRIHCTFLIGKSRLAHLKPMTVPRLELSAAVLAVQLDKSVREELDVPVTQSTYWSDSTCVLQYIRNQSKRFHTFVANRLSVIHENSAPHQWRHLRRFPFNKNSGLKFRKLHVLNGTVHYRCTDPTQATARFVIVASQHTHNYALKEKSKYCLYPKEHSTVEKGRKNPISCRKPMNASEGKKFL